MKTGKPQPPRLVLLSTVVAPAVCRPGSTAFLPKNEAWPTACRADERKKKISFLILMIGFLSVGTLATAADFDVTASLDRQQMSLNDQAVLSLTITGSATNLPAPQLPGLPDFQVQPSGTSQNFTWINGKASGSVTYTYILTPLHEGAHQVPPIRVQYQGQSAQTAPLTLTVVKGDTSAVSAQSAPATEPTEAPAPERKSNALYITGTIDKTSAYVGEPITYTFRLYNRVPLLRQPAYQKPDTAGFWAEDLPDQRNFQTTIKGVPYNVTELRTVLFPTASGTAHIGAAGLQVMMENVGTDPFSNDFFANFFGRGEQKDLHTEPLSVHVRPLPEPKPAGFKGAIGHYTFSAALDKSVGAVGQPLQLTLTVSGRGNLKSLPDIPLPPLTNFRTFDTTASTSLDKKESQIQGAKLYRTVLIPTASGTLGIPSVPFVYFDTESGTYKTLHSSAFNVTVNSAPAGSAATNWTPTPTSGASSAPSAPSSTAGIQMLSEDIRYIKTPGSISAQGTPWVQQKWFWFLHGLVFLSVVAGGAFRLYQKLFLSDRALARFKKAREQSQADIQLAEKAIDSNRIKEASGLLGDAMRNFLYAKLSDDGQSLALRDVLEALRRRGIISHEVEKVRNLWETLDLFQFAPTQVRVEELRQASKTLEHVLDELEAGLVWKK